MFNFLHTHLPDPIAFSIGPIAVHWYGLLIVAAIFLGLGLTAKLGRRYGIQKDQVYDLGFWIIIFAIVGARVYFIFLEMAYFISNPLDAFKVWQGGLAIHGAIIGGLLAVYFYFIRHPCAGGDPEIPDQVRDDKRVWQWLDAVAPALALGQAIGRWGNYFNQELFGRPTDLPWGIPISALLRPVEYVQFEYFHPAFLYESVLNFMIFGVLLLLHRRPEFNSGSRKAGSIFLIYLILYSLVRIFTETLRLDPTIMIAGIRLPQIVSGIVIVGSLYLLVKKSKLTESGT